MQLWSALAESAKSRRFGIASGPIKLYIVHLEIASAFSVPAMRGLRSLIKQIHRY
jgi:hypothetical protein